MTRRGSLRVSLVCLSALAFGFPAFASTLSFTGALPADDAVVLFQYTVPTTGSVNVETTSYANGGFSPILSLFDNLGNLLFYNNGYPSNSDAQLSWNSLANQSYTVALTEYDNLPLGPTLADGFAEQGNGNFTALPPFNPPLPGAFYLPGPIQLTGNWAVTFSANSAISASEAPEPGPGVLLFAGAAVLSIFGRLRRYC
jgi:hypothetical protein